MAESLEEQRHNLTYAIGDCILAWANVEYYLTMVFSRCMRDEFLAAAFAFDAVVSLPARLSMVDEVLKANRYHAAILLTDDHLKDWKSIKNRIKDKYSLRNQIAHCGLVDIKVEGNPEVAMLLPYPAVTREMNGVLLNEKLLKERKESFDHLAGRVKIFYQELDRYLAQPPASP